MVIASQLPLGASVVSAGLWTVRSTAAARSAGPSNRPQTTNGPTASRAASFTIDSKAIASIMPRCCSLACTWRTPNRMVKTAISRATMKAVSYHTGWPVPGSKVIGPASAAKVVETACNCSAT